MRLALLGLGCRVWVRVGGAIWGCDLDLVGTGVGYGGYGGVEIEEWGAWEVEGRW